MNFLDMLRKVALSEERSTHITWNLTLFYGLLVAMNKEDMFLQTISIAEHLITDLTFSLRLRLFLSSFFLFPQVSVTDVIFQIAASEHLPTLITLFFLPLIFALDPLVEVTDMIGEVAFLAELLPALFALHGILFSLPVSSSDVMLEISETPEDFPTLITLRLVLLVSALVKVTDVMGEVTFLAEDLSTLVTGHRLVSPHRFLSSPFQILLQILLHLLLHLLLLDYVKGLVDKYLITQVLYLDIYIF